LGLQMDDLFAMTLKPEMSGFDNTGMHRPHAHFMDLLAPHGIERIRSRNSLLRDILPKIGNGTIIRVISYRLEPRVPFGKDRPLLCDLAFEQMRLEELFGQRFIAWRFRQNFGRKYLQFRFFINRQDCNKANVPPVLQTSEKVCKAGAVTATKKHFFAKFLFRQERNIF